MENTDALRMILAAATGAVIGGVVIIALSWTIRVLGHPAAAGPAPVPATGIARIATRAARLHWSVKLAILALSVFAYGFLGYSNRPAPVDTVAVTPDTNNMAADVAPLSARFLVGGVVVSFDPPAGYCSYPAPLFQMIVVQQGKINPDNAIHTVFGKCDQLREAANTQARIRDFGMLMTPRDQLEQTIDKPALDRIVASAVDPHALRETLDQRLRQAQSRMKLQSYSALGILERDQNAAYFGYLFKTGTDAGGYNQACVMALTTVKGRLVSYYLYSDYSRDARGALMGLLQKVRAGLSDLAAQNI